MLCLGKIFENPESNDAWEQRLGWINSSQNYRNFDRIDGEPMDFEWNIFQDSIRCSSVKKSKVYCTDWEKPENFTGRILFVSMFNDISCGTKDNEQECLANARLVSLYANRFGKGQWSFTGPVSEKSGTLSRKTVHKESGTKLQKGCCWNSLKADVQFSVLRLHCPEVSSKAKDTVNCRYTMQRTRKRLRLFSHNCFCTSAQSFRSSRRNV